MIRGKLLNIRDFWQLFIGVILGVFGIFWVAWGGTYNFYFNNTEQGNNSTATPSVTVSDGKVPPTSTVQTGGPVPLAPESTPLPASITSPSVTQAQEPPLPSLEHEFKRWKFTASGILMTGSQNAPAHDGFGGVLGLGYQLSKGVGLALFVGALDPNARHMYYSAETFLGGLDLELQLLRLSLGRFDNLIEAGILLGGSSYLRAQGNIATLHGGVRLNVNLGNQWGLTAAGRANLGYLMGEAGILIRL